MGNKLTNEPLPQANQPSPQPEEIMANPSSRLPLLLAILAGVILIGSAVILLSKSPFQPKPEPVQPPVPVPTNQATQTLPTDPTADWKIYTNQDGFYSFKYPAGWVLTEEKDGVRVIIEPDYRTVVGACPGYSFWAGELDSYANYSIYTPLHQITINNQNISYYSKTNTYNCTSNIAFVNKSIVVSLTSKKANNQQLFNQILSTFKFTE